MLLSHGRFIAGLVGAVVFSLLVSSAQAQASSAQASIDAKRRTIPRTTAEGYFAQALEPVALVAPDGGASQLFGGSTGRGAIYWSPSTGAHIVYGNVLRYYEVTGAQQGFGYPQTDPIAGPGTWCDDETTFHQRFVRSSAATDGRALSVQIVTLCSTPTGVFEGTRVFT